ncbi:uncharacterized protein LOC110711930 [Chenopodium quinoa]|uniref:uncharacterized protein LOC110711930 n=1 Tax=Chenopodium quinoa TaxID=63459 RepID=UPI000B77A81E|nr:uncharacterized protein LOC110711930 [Chenopodium quinoa]
MRCVVQVEYFCVDVGLIVRYTSRQRRRMANNDALADAIRLLAENLNQNRNDNPDPAGEMFMKLAQVKPPYFKGGGDPTFLENWIREFDKIFAALNCPENMRVDQAAMYLKDKVDIWWRDNGNMLRAEANFGLETFKTKLREKFYPPFLRKQKAQEFINLQMNNMSITEYYNKFMNLSRFSPEVVPTEELKAQRLEQGLTKQLQKDLDGKTFKTLDKLYRRATHLYSLNVRSATESGNVREKRKDFGNSSHQGNFKKPRNENFQNRNFQNNGGSSKTTSQVERHYNCKRCGKDHPGKDCDGNLVVCICNKKGHREFKCFSKLKQQGNGNKFTPTSNQGGNSNDHNRNAKSGNVGNNNSRNQGRMSLQVVCL